MFEITSTKCKFDCTYFIFVWIELKNLSKISEMPLINETMNSAVFELCFASVGFKLLVKRQLHELLRIE